MDNDSVYFQCCMAGYRIDRNDMQLKLFQYKQVEEQAPKPAEAPKRNRCCCGSIWVTATLIALLITFTTFVVPQLYANYNDEAVDFTDADGVVEILTKVEVDDGVKEIRNIKDIYNGFTEEEIKMDQLIKQAIREEQRKKAEAAEPGRVIHATFEEEEENERGDGPCEGVRSCLVEYYSIWDIDASEALPPYVDFFHRIQNNFEHLHEFAIDLICLAQEEAKNCMAADLAVRSKDFHGDLQQCLSVQGWMENFGVKKLDAREYAADFRVRGFECKNEKFLKENFKCLYPTTQNRKEDLDICSADLRKALDEKEDACTAMDNYITCAREIFIEECGEQVSSFTCNIIETAMIFNYPTCKSVFQTCE